MSIVFGSTEVTDIVYDGTSLDSVVFNGTEVFSKAGVELTIGAEYIIGGFKFYCAEKLANNIYAMQMSNTTGEQKYAHGQYPPCQKTGSSTPSNYAYQNSLAPGYYNATYEADLLLFYNRYSSIEASGGRGQDGIYSTNNAKNGLYLMPREKLTTSSYDFYFTGLKSAAVNYSYFNAPSSANYAWVGSKYITGNNAYAVSTSKYTYRATTTDNVIAPVFNIDTTKISIFGNKITKKSPVKLVSWADGTDAEIAAMVAAADAGQLYLSDIWEVGDARIVEYDAMAAAYSCRAHVAQWNYLVLAAADNGTTDSTNPCYNYQYVTATSGRTYPSFIVTQKEGLRETGSMYPSSITPVSWKNCNRRSWCNDTYRAAIPSSLRSIFKQVKVKTAEPGGASLQTTNDYFFFPTEKEVFDSKSKAYDVEYNNLSRWRYYGTSSYRKKKEGPNGSSYANWQLRSPYNAMNSCFVIVTANGANTYTSATTNTLIAPAGCI